MKKLFLILPLLFCVATASAASLPMIDRVEGSVLVSGEAARVGMRLAEGARIETKNGARAVIRLDNGTMTSLRERSLFEVVKARDGEYAFRLSIGGLRSRVRGLGAHGSYTVVTPAAVAGVRGTDFSVDVEDDGRTELRVHEGAVEFHSPATGARIMVNMNHSARADAAGRLGNVKRGIPKPQGDPEFSSTGRDEVLAAIKVPVQMDRLIQEGMPANEAVKIIRTFNNSRTPSTQVGVALDAVSGASGRDIARNMPDFGEFVAARAQEGARGPELTSAIHAELGARNIPVIPRVDIPRRPEIPAQRPEIPERPEIPAQRPEIPERPEIPARRPETPQAPRFQPPSLPRLP